MKATLIITGALCFGVCLSSPRTAGADEPNAANQPIAIVTAEKEIKILDSRRMIECRLSKQNGSLDTDTARPAESNALVQVEFEADFPRGGGWDLAVFVLKDKGVKDRIFLPMAFTVSGESNLRPFYKAEQGAAGLIQTDKKVTIMDNPIGKPGQIYFGYLQRNGKDEEWPGGTAAVKLVYEIPKTSTKLELAKAERVAMPVPGVGNQVLKSPAQSSTTPNKEFNWPKMTEELLGQMEVRVKNPNDFKVKVGLRSGSKGKDFAVGANDTQSVSIPNGRYDIYFQYSTDPDGLYQGDSFTLQNNGAEITITKVVNGNYGIRKVK